MRKITKRICVPVAIMMALIMFLNPVTEITAQAITSEGVYQNEPVEKEEEVSGNIIAEQEEERDEHIKHFLLDNGNVLVAQYESPVHYQDESGNWVDYDNTLKEVSVQPDLTEEEQTSSQESIELAAENEEAATETEAELERKSETAQGQQTASEASDEVEYTNKKSNIDIRFAKRAKENKMVKIEKDGYQISMGYANINKNQNLSVVKDTDKLEGNESFLNRKKAISEAVYENVF